MGEPAMIVLVISAEADRVHHPGDAGCLKGDRFRHLPLEIRINQAGQINDAIHGLYLEQIGGLKRWMRIE